MMSCALLCRPWCWRDFRVIDRRPLFSVGLPPSAPMNDATESTSGSPRMTSATAICRCIIDENDTSGGACVTPRSSPVSCCGNRPFGTTYASATVTTTVAIVASNVERSCASNHPSARS